MTQPLALVLYEKLLPGSRVVNLLQDLNYRVQSINDPGMLIKCAEQGKPMVVLADLEPSRNNICAVIGQLKENPATRHLPVIAFSGDTPSELKEAARSAGVTLLVTEAAVVGHLPQLLDQALQVE